MGVQDGPNPDKIHEQIGWAVSEDGLTFTEFPFNPVVPWNESIPRTIATAEAHVWFESDMIYVFHTVRWDVPNSPPPTGGPYRKDPFAPDGRNAEDLGVSLLSPSPVFKLDVPLISEFWKLDLAAKEESPCSYDWRQNRYCHPLKVVISGKGGSGRPVPKLAPALQFSVEADSVEEEEDGFDLASASGSPSSNFDVLVFRFDDDGVGKHLATLPVVGKQLQSASPSFRGITEAVVLGKDSLGSDGVTWVVAKVRTSQAGAKGVRLSATYKSTEANVLDSEGSHDVNFV